MRRLGPCVVAASAALLLTACGGGGDSSDRGGPADDPTSLPSATPRDPEAAEHFIRRWAAATQRMETTGKTKRYLRLTRTCDVCLALAHNIEHRYKVGGYMRWDGLKILTIKSPPNVGPVMLYTVRAVSAPITIRDSATAKVLHAPSRRVTYLLGVQTLRHSYSVTSVTQN